MGNRAGATAVYRPVPGSAQVIAATTGASANSTPLNGNARHVVMWGEVAFRFEIGGPDASAASAAIPANAPFSFVAYDGEVISVLGLANGNVHLWEATT